MKVKIYFLSFFLLFSFSLMVISQEQAPKRFFLRFTEAYLVFEPGSQTLQIVSQGNVLSYGQDWQVKQMKGYLYHMRQNIWKDFYWKVNTSRKQVYRVKGGTFGQYGGEVEVLNIKVDVVSLPKKPMQFLLRFSDAYLVHVPGSKTLQITAQGNVLSYGQDWQVKQMKPYLYHMRQNFWKGFFWKVNTSRKQIYRVKGGTFGEYGGEEELLDITVDVVN